MTKATVSRQCWAAFQFLDEFGVFFLTSLLFLLVPLLISFEFIFFFEGELLLSISTFFYASISDSASLPLPPPGLPVVVVVLLLLSKFFSFKRIQSINNLPFPRRVVGSRK